MTAPPTIEDELLAAMPMTRGSDALDLRHEYLSKFEATRRAIKKKRGKSFCCEGCGLQSVELDFHHCIPILEIVTKGLDHSLIWDEHNLVVACRHNGPNGHEAGCHFHICHTVGSHSSWSISDPQAREDLAKHRKGTQLSGTSGIHLE